ncbi:MAG TPA: hypothetical protein VGH16_15815 [Candidatus Binatia bacterium]|jgi:hypothetical protein
MQAPIAIRTVENSYGMLRVTTGDRDEHVADFRLAGKTITYPFYSSYDGYRIDVINLSGHATPEIVMVTGAGRGTSVRKEILRVFSPENGKLKTLLETTVSEFFGEGLRWWYEVSYMSAENALCTDLVLQLRHDDPRDYNGWGGVQLIPTEREKIISFCNR